MYVFYSCETDPGGLERPEGIPVLEAAAYMQSFIEDISAYAHKLKPGFIIIPQNGEEIAFIDMKPSSGILMSFLDAVDGFGVEELFFNDKGNPINDHTRLAMLETLRDNGKKIMVSDYVRNDIDYNTSLLKNYTNNFIAFPRSINNYGYRTIPEIKSASMEMFDFNSGNITALSDAKNYLYFLNDDSYWTNKQKFLDEIGNTNYDVILIDLEFAGKDLTLNDLKQIRTKKDGGSRLIISYISIGSAEKYRYYWKSGWRLNNPSWIWKSYSGYPDEFWVRFWDPRWQDIIFGNDKSYIKKIIDAGFDGAYLDNIGAIRNVN